MSVGIAKLEGRRAARRCGQSLRSGQRDRPPAGVGPQVARRRRPCRRRRPRNAGSRFRWRGRHPSSGASQARSRSRSSPTSNAVSAVASGVEGAAVEFAQARRLGATAAAGGRSACRRPQVSQRAARVEIDGIERVRAGDEQAVARRARRNRGWRRDRACGSCRSVRPAASGNARRRRRSTRHGRAASTFSPSQ